MDGKKFEEATECSNKIKSALHFIKLLDDHSIIRIGDRQISYDLGMDGHNEVRDSIIRTLESIIDREREKFDSL